MSLNDLFIQILESEQKARERKRLYNEIKGKLAEVSQQLHSTQEEVNKLQTEVSSKRQDLSAEELEFQWTTSKHTILNDQLEEQKRQKIVYEEDMTKKRSLQGKHGDEFKSEVSKFVSSFGLTGNGEEHRLSVTREQLEQSKVKQNQLEAELKYFEREKELLFNFEQEKIATETEIDLLKTKTKDIREKLEKEKMKTHQLEEKKSKIAQKPHSDREFKRLQTELDTCRDDSLEDLCQALQQQIEELRQQQPPPQRAAYCNNKPATGKW